MRFGSTNTSSKLSEREVTKHEMARYASRESMMTNKGKHQKGVKNLFKDNNFTTDWSLKRMKKQIQITKTKTTHKD